MNQSESDIMDRRANEQADRVCEVARAQHPGLDKELLKKDAWAYRVAQQVIRYAAAALDLFPENGIHRRKAPGERGERPSRIQLGHQWVQIPVDKKMRW